MAAGSTVAPNDWQTVDPGDWTTVAGPSVPGMEKLGGTPPPAAGPKLKMQGDNAVDPLNSRAVPFVGGPYKAAEAGANMILHGTGRAVGGVERMAQPGLSNKAAGAHDVFSGAGEAAAPLVLPYAAATAAVPTAVGLAAGTAAGTIATQGLKSLGVPDEYADLGGDVAGIAAGGYAAKKTPNVALKDVPGKVTGAIADQLKGDTPPALLVRGIKPVSSATGFPETLDRSMPELKASEQQLGKPIETIDDLLAATKIAKQRVWSQWEQMAGPQRAMGSTVDLTPVADAIEASIPDKLKLENPQAAAAMMEMAAKYRGRFPLQQAESFLKTSNAELDSYYAKYPTAKRTSAAANPEVAALDAQASAFRGAINNTLDDASGGAAPREVKQRYGALLQMEEAAERRRITTMRQQPSSLSEQVSKWSGYGKLARGGFKAAGALFSQNPSLAMSAVGDVAEGVTQQQIALMMKEAQSTNGLIKRAFATYTGAPKPINMPPTRQPAGLLTPGAIRTPPPADPSGVNVTTGAPLQPQTAPTSRQLPRGTVRTQPPADTSRVTVTTGAPLRQQPAPASHQLSRGAIRTPPPPDPSKVSAVPAMPVIDPDTGEVLYYTTAAASRQTPNIANTLGRAVLRGNQQQ